MAVNPKRSPKENMKSVLSILIVFISSLAFSGNKKNADDVWLKKKYSKLAKIKKPMGVKKVKLWGSDEKNDKGLYSYHPKGDGLIVFQDKSWVLIVSHTGHSDDGIGDLALIRTSKGEYYLNRGHCCKTLLMRSSEKINSLKTFLKAHGLGKKAAPVQWKPFKIPSAKKANKKKAANK